VSERQRGCRPRTNASRSGRCLLWRLAASSTAAARPAVRPAYPARRRRGERHLANAQQIGSAHAQTRGGVRFALQAVGPFGRSEVQRIEQHVAGIVRQLLARALGDQSAQQRGGAAIGVSRPWLGGPCLNVGPTATRSEAIGSLRTVARARRFGPAIHKRTCRARFTRHGCLRNSPTRLGGKQTATRYPKADIEHRALRATRCARPDRLWRARKEIKPLLRGVGIPPSTHELHTPTHLRGSAPPLTAPRPP